MTMITLRQLLDHAMEHGYGLPAFNISNMEQIQAVLAAAKKTGAPALLAASSSARKYMGDIMLRRMVEASAEAYPDIPVCLHQDHGRGVDVCVTALAGGFTSVMMDGSLLADGKTPATHEYNAETTRKVVELAHMLGASVEGEIGVIGSLETGTAAKEDGHGAEGKLSRDQLITSPDEAAWFVGQSHVDALAVAIGTSHGAYKFTRKPTGDILAIEAIAKIKARLPNTPLVMHGASSVPERIREEINKYGGAMKETYGVPLDEIARGIKMGVCKVNVDTDGRMAMTAAVRRTFGEHPEEFDLRAYMKAAREGMQAMCEERYEAFGAAGKAAGIKPIALADMAKAYAAGKYEPVIN
ncbi:fructose-1,6-bisphosphate aldolase [Alphaproteobacteria bacterium]|nr:fructose-1,6-bisphosphate aldolase [Alphaproteobacteria bacterium]